jgi:hypothetical protein
MFDGVPSDLTFVPFPQGPAYATAARALGAGVRQIDLGCGTVQVLERAGRRVALRGPVWDTGATDGDKRRALRRLARFAGVTLVTPEQDLRGFGLIPLVTPAHHAIWDLSGDLRAGLAGKWRNRLAAAERAGHRIGPASLKRLPDLVAAEAAQRATKGYRSLPPAFTLALPPHSLRLFDWRHAGAIGAAMAFVIEGATATYHLGWANDAARQHHIHPLMLYRAARALQAEGVRWLDLGLVNTEDAPGLARFKLGTGAALHRLGSTLLVLPG